MRVWLQSGGVVSFLILITIVYSILISNNSNNKNFCSSNCSVKQFRGGVMIRGGVIIIGGIMIRGVVSPQL